MNVIMAVNEKIIEKFVSNMKECNVLKVVKNNKTLLKDVLNLNPHLVLISNYLPGKEKIEEIIIKLRNTQPHTRIVYLYGDDDSFRKRFTNFLIENKVYDFHVGAIDEDVLNELILEPKNSDDVKAEDISVEEEEMIKEQLKAKEEYLSQLREELLKEELEKEQRDKKVMPTVGINELTKEKSKEDEISEQIEEKIEERIVKEVVKQLQVQIIDRIEEVEIIKEKAVIIEKKIREEVKVEVINNSTIAVISNDATGKSFISWNISHCFAKRGYKTSVINLDRGYSANCYYGIDSEEESALKDSIESRDSEIESNVLEKFYYVSENLQVFTNEICSKKELDDKKFLKLLNLIQANSDITIVDCKSEVNEVLKTAIMYCQTIILIFDTNYMHYNMNLDMLNDILEILNPKKVIAVINNVYEGSSELDFILENIKGIEKEIGHFKDIVIIKNCPLGLDSMYTSSCAYFEAEDKEFNNSIDNLLNALKAKEKKKTKSILDRFLEKINRKEV